MMMTGVVMIMVVVVLLCDKKVGLDVENAVEIEGPPFENVGERDVAFPRTMQRSVGIDRADARLDLSQLMQASRDRSC